MTTHDHRDDRWTDRLSEYLDGELEAGERAELEAHLAGCAWCAAVLDDLGAVVRRSGSLESSAPATDLWPAIRAEIEAGRAAAAEAAPAAQPRTLDIRRHRRWEGWRLTLSMPQAVAAGLTLALLSAGGMWLAMRPIRSSAPPLTAARTPAVTPPAPGTAPATGPQTGAPAGEPGVAVAPSPDPSGVALAAFSDPRYDATIAELQRTLAEGRGKLDTTTVRILEQNLAIIDRALEEARRAVAADPANTYLRSHLASTMRRKVDLLRRATVIVGAHG